MPQIVRLNDANDAGGQVINIPQGDVYVNGTLVSINGSQGTSHPPCGDPGDDIHCQGNWVTANGSSTVFVHGISVNRIGDMDTCDHTRIDGSSNVYAGG